MSINKGVKKVKSERKMQPHALNITISRVCLNYDNSNILATSYWTVYFSEGVHWYIHL